MREEEREEAKGFEERVMIREEGGGTDTKRERNRDESRGLR